MIIYKATNLINNKSYIGMTSKTLSVRRTEHKSSSNRTKKGVFHKALSKYGIDSFKWEIIDTASSRDILREQEKFYIKQFKPEYNMTNGGDGANTYQMCNQRKAKISATLKGRSFPHMFGKRDPSVGLKISKTSMGKKMSPEAMVKTRLANLGKVPWNKGMTQIEMEEYRRRLNT